MRKIIGFFTGGVVVILVIVAVFAGVRLYNYSGITKINLVLFQSADLRQNRIESPVPIDKIPDRYLRDLLLAQFANEYLRVTPYNDPARGSILQSMSSPDVINNWQKNVMPTITDLSKNHVLREVIIDRDGIEIRGDFFVVPYKLKTFSKPNDLNASPVISGGQSLFMKVRFNKQLRQNPFGKKFDAGVAMDNGLPPAAIFDFIVYEVIIK